MKGRNRFVAFFIWMSIVSLHAQNLPFQNPNLSANERAKDLLSRLTLDEKISLTMNNSPAIPRLGIPQYDWWSEALHGVARAGNATVFPQTIGMAATFDDKGVNDAFNMISDEARAKHHDFIRKDQFRRYQGLTFWTPNINIFRDPRWGRGMETYGEDPYLTTCMGVAVVKGLQGDGLQKYDKVHACAKHYAVHSGPEWSRHSFDAKNISKRDLYETYLPAFKALVKDAGVKEVMCAYNRFEGEPCCSNKQLLVNILRKDWAYDNVVVSDCGAITDFFKEGKHETHTSAATASADAVISTTDLACDGAYAALGDAVKNNLIYEKQIDQSVFRLLRARFQLGMFDPDSLVSWASIPMSVVECDTHKAQALEMARKSLVLLQNKNNALPLKKTLKRVAVMGPNANDSVMLWANYNGFPSKSITILEGIKSKLPSGSVVYEKGCDLVENKVFTSYISQCSFKGKKGFEATFWNNRELSGEIAATDHLSQSISYVSAGNTVFAPGVNLTDFSARFQTTFAPLQTNDVVFKLSGDDGFRLFIDGKEVVSNWNVGKKKKSEYILNAEAGKKYEIVAEYFQAGGGCSFTMNLGFNSDLDYNAIAQKVKDVDAIVFVGGISASLEGEEMSVNYPGFRGGDRTNIDLPPVQENLLKALKALGKPVVFVLCSGSAMALSWENHNLDAILEAWYPGQAGGSAVADVLFGDYNPAGRLPITFYNSTTDLPDFEDYNMAGRTYRYFKGKPLYPFGYGLSYTTFEYVNATVSKSTMKVNEQVELNITLKNTGKIDGDEVVQVYIRNLQDKEGPAKSLRGFKRVAVHAGETIPVKLTLPASSFQFFDAATNEMIVKPGKYEILYGGTSDDTLLKKIDFTVNN